VWTQCSPGEKLSGVISTVTEPKLFVYSDTTLYEDSEAVYVRMRRYLRDRNIELDISRNQLDLNDTLLGSGQFGSVCRAIYRIDGEPPVTVAVKTLKTTSLCRHVSKQVTLSNK